MCYSQCMCDCDVLLAAAPQMQQQQLQQLLLAVFQPSLFGDERDALVAKWNALQALWGTGRGYCNQQGQYVDFTRSNPFCAFKVSCCNVYNKCVSFSRVDSPVAYCCQLSDCVVYK